MVRPLLCREKADCGWGGGGGCLVNVMNLNWIDCISYDALESDCETETVSLETASASGAGRHLCTEGGTFSRRVGPSAEEGLDGGRTWVPLAFAGGPSVR